MVPIHAVSSSSSIMASLLGVIVDIFFLMYVTVSCTWSTLSCRCPISSCSSSLESFACWFPSSRRDSILSSLRFILLSILWLSIFIGEFCVNMSYKESDFGCYVVYVLSGFVRVRCGFVLRFYVCEHV